jgi:hypothetical protein
MCGYQMLNCIAISQCSKDLILSIKKSLRAADDSYVNKAELIEWLDGPQLQDETIDTLYLIAWLKKAIEVDNESQFLLESLRASLLQDLFNAIPESHRLNDSVVTSSNEELFNFLIIAGTIVAICEGFDGIASILALFPAVPAVVVFLLGAVFALVSVVVFYGFNLDTIAKHLGVKIQHTDHLIDIYLHQLQQIVKLREAISTHFCGADSEEQEVLFEMAGMLTIRYSGLDNARRTYKADLNSYYVTVAKSITSAVAGMVFFGGGFLSGHAVSLAFANLYASAVVATFWPVLVASTVVGLAAFSIYWFVQRPGLERLVSRWLGLDEDKIEALVDEDVVKDQLRGLNQLTTQLEGVGMLHQRIRELNRNRVQEHPSFQSVAANAHSFFNKDAAEHVLDFEEKNDIYIRP